MGDPTKENTMPTPPKPTPEQTAKDNPVIAASFGGTRNLAIWLRYLSS